jgi:hypothetical protein
MTKQDFNLLDELEQIRSRQEETLKSLERIEAETNPSDALKSIELQSRKVLESLDEIEKANQGN